MSITRILTAGVGLGLVAMLNSACATLGGAAVGAAIGAGAGKGAGDGALIGAGGDAAAGAIYGVTRR